MDSFWAKVGEPDSSGCRNWTGYKSNGYGQFYVGGKYRAAHKYIYESVHGPVPDGLELDHLCANRSCVNLDHLEAVTHRENMRRIFLRRGPKPFCVRGHAMTEENTLHYIWRERHKRMCRACITENAEKYKREGRRTVAYLRARESTLHRSADAS